MFESPKRFEAKIPAEGWIDQQIIKVPNKKDRANGMDVRPF